MFTSTSAVQDFKTCIRCQYRMTFSHHARSGRRNRLLNLPASRYSTSNGRLLRKEGQPATAARAAEKFLSFPRKLNEVKSIRRHWKYDDMYSTDTLNADALGAPAKIILLRQAQTKDVHRRTDKVESATENHNLDISSTEIMRKLEEENALVNAEKVPINIDTLRISWVSQLQNRFSSPTKAEYLQMVKSLSEGFTTDQLREFYDAETAKLPENMSKLSRPHSTDLYTRMSWKPDSSRSFDSKTGDRVIAKKNKFSCEFKAVEDGKQCHPNWLTIFKHEFPSHKSLAKSIIHFIWNVKVEKDLGELDIWVEPIPFALLLSDRKNMLRTTVKSYGAKLDLLQSHHVLRITSDRETCCDIFETIHRTLENIDSVEVDLYAEPAFLNESSIKQIEQLTNTVIQRISRSMRQRKDFKRKFRIFSIGPDRDYLDSVEGIFTATSPSTFRTVPVLARHRGEFGKGSLYPIEVGELLPLMARGIQWFRWTSPIERSSLAQPKSRLYTWWTGGASHMVENMLFYSPTPDSPTTDMKSRWSHTPELEIYANFGQTVFPRDRLEKLQRELEAKVTTKISNELYGCMASQRQLVCGFPGLRSLLQDADPNMRAEEDLRIRLRPSPQLLRNPKEKRGFPDLELRIKWNPITRVCQLSSARLIIERRELDVLLPGEQADVRFCAETCIPSGAQINAQIQSFVNSSNVDVFGQESFQTPSAVFLSIPARSLRKAPRSKAHFTQIPPNPGKCGDRFVKEGPDATMKYVLSSVEHWSHMTGTILGLKLDYSFIDGGRWGRREEIRVDLHESNQQGENLQTFRKRLNLIPGLVRRFQESTTRVEIEHRHIAPPLARDG